MNINLKKNKQLFTIIQLAKNVWVWNMDQLPHMPRVTAMNSIQMPIYTECNSEKMSVLKKKLTARSEHYISTLVLVC